MKLLDHIMFGDFLDRDNPFSAAREPRSRDMFSDENNRLLHTWSRTTTALPGAILAAFLIGPISRWVGLEPGPAAILFWIGAALPFFVLGFGLATGIPAFWMRHTLMRDADKLRAMEHELETMIARDRRL